MGSLGFSRWQAASGCKKLVQKKKTIPIVNLLRAPLLKGQTGDSSPFSNAVGYIPLWRIAVPHAASFPEQRICIKNLQLPKSPEKKAKQIEN
jgi:hypothetical protein